MSGVEIKIYTIYYSDSGPVIGSPAIDRPARALATVTGHRAVRYVNVTRNVPYKGTDSLPAVWWTLCSMCNINMASGHLDWNQLTY